MTTQNITAQPGLTDAEIQAIWVEHGLDDEAVEDFARAIESALLSKLRAPVADDLAHRLRAKYPVGPMIDGEPEFGWRDYSGPAPVGMRLPSPIMLEAAEAIERLCGAPVASAPVADSTLPFEQALYELMNKIDPGLDTGDLLQDAGRASAALDAIMASAPVAGEAKDADPTPKDQYRRMFTAACAALGAVAEKLGLDPDDAEPDVMLTAIDELIARAADAAPQAGEAVRDAAFEAVRKRLCAIPRYSFYLDDDGVVRRVEGRSGNWIEFDAAHELFDPVSVDSALSAQPGAQKQGQSDA